MKSLAFGLAVLLLSATVACNDAARESIPTEPVSAPGAALRSSQGDTRRHLPIYSPGKPIRGGKKGAVTLSDPCPIQGEIPDECPLEYQDSDEEIPIATPAGTPTGDEPLWTGQAFDISTVPTSCSPVLQNQNFSIYVPEYGAEVLFAGVGVFTRIAVLPSEFGIARARYQLGAGPYFSVRPLGTYYASGGTLDAWCLTGRYQTGPTIALYLGKMIFDNYTGTVRRKGASNTGGGDDATERGWAADNDGTVTGDVTSGASNTPLNAINDFLNNDVCTPGWEIWVDGAIMCFADGTHS